MNAGELLDVCTRRVRGEGGLAHSESLVLAILSKCQAVVNCNKQSLVSSVVVSTIPRKLFYALSDIIPDAIDILDVQYEDKSLACIPNYDFIAMSCGYSWFRSIADHPQSWCQIGKSLLALWPGCERSVNVTVRYIKEPTKFVNRNVTLEIKNEHFADLERLGEISLLLRQRHVADAVSLIKAK